MPPSLIMRKAIPSDTLPSVVIYEHCGSYSLTTLIYAEIHQIIISHSIHLPKAWISSFLLTCYTNTNAQCLCSRLEGHPEKNMCKISSSGKLSDNNTDDPELKIKTLCDDKKWATSERCLTFALEYKSYISINAQ